MIEHRVPHPAIRYLALGRMSSGAGRILPQPRVCCDIKPSHFAQTAPNFGCTTLDSKEVRSLSACYAV